MGLVEQSHQIYMNGCANCCETTGVKMSAKHCYVYVHCVHEYVSLIAAEGYCHHVT